MNQTNLKKIFSLLIILFFFLLFGTFGYHYIEEMSLFDSFYMTVITMSTVGFSEIKELSQSGRIITIFIITGGITIGGYTIGSILKMLIEGELKKTIGRKKLDKKISSLKNHYIICGYGRIGSLIAEELEKQGYKFVIIENSPEVIDILDEEKVNYINMDATTEEAIISAGINKARGLVTAVHSDADNVFITLTARSLNPDIFILSRASDAKNESKLKRAGATKVILPYLIGGRRMANALIRPAVVDFIDIAMMGSDLGLTMEELEVDTNSNLVGKNLIESKLRKKYGIIIVAIKKESGKMVFNPLPEEIIDVFDKLVVLGRKKDLEKIRKET